MATLTIVCVVFLSGRRYDLLPGTCCSGRSSLRALYFNPSACCCAEKLSSPILIRLNQSPAPSCPNTDSYELVIQYRSKKEQALSIIKLHLVQLQPKCGKSIKIFPESNLCCRTWLRIKNCYYFLFSLTPIYTFINVCKNTCLQIIFFLLYIDIFI